MNAVWKDVILFLVELILIAVVLYKLRAFTRYDTTFYLLLLLLVILTLHFFINTRRTFFHFGAWFYCYV